MLPAQLRRKKCLVLVYLTLAVAILCSYLFILGDREQPIEPNSEFCDGENVNK